MTVGRVLEFVLKGKIDSECDSVRGNSLRTISPPCYRVVRSKLKLFSTVRIAKMGDIHIMFLTHIDEMHCGTLATLRRVAFDFVHCEGARGLRLSQDSDWIYSIWEKKKRFQEPLLCLTGAYGTCCSGLPFACSFTSILPRVALE